MEVTVGPVYSCVISRDPHRFGVPAWVVGMGTHGYGYRSCLGYL